MVPPFISWPGTDGLMTGSMWAWWFGKPPGPTLGPVSLKSSPDQGPAMMGRPRQRRRIGQTTPADCASYQPAVDNALVNVQDIASQLNDLNNQVQAATDPDTINSLYAQLETLASQYDAANAAYNQASGALSDCLDTVATAQAAMGRSRQRRRIGQTTPADCASYQPPVDNALTNVQDIASQLNDLNNQIQAATDPDTINSLYAQLETVASQYDAANAAYNQASGALSDCMDTVATAQAAMGRRSRPARSSFFDRAPMLGQVRIKLGQAPDCSAYQSASDAANANLNSIASQMSDLNDQIQAATDPDTINSMYTQLETLAGQYDAADAAANQATASLAACLTSGIGTAVSSLGQDFNAPSTPPPCSTGYIALNDRGVIKCVSASAPSGMMNMSPQQRSFAVKAWYGWRQQ